MHELHLAQDIFKKIRERMGEERVGRISGAKIALGQSRFTHLDELLELFADISGGIKLEIDIIPVKTACADCRTEFSPQTMRLDCEKCGSTNIQMISGDELVIKELKV